MTKQKHDAESRGQADSKLRSAASSLSSRGRAGAVVLPMASALAFEEPTAEMVAAGVAVLWESGAIEAQLDSDELLVSEIFQAMWMASSSR